MRPAAPFARAVVVTALAVTATVLACSRSDAAPGAGSSRVPASGASPAAPASTGTLRLLVLDAETGEPVAWANVVSLDGSHGYLADGNGIVEVKVPAGPARYRAVHVSYRPSPEIYVEIAAGGVRERTVFLAPSAYEVETIQIRADRVHSPGRSVEGIRSLSAENTAALPNPTDDAFRTVRMLPGVSSGDVGSRFHLRGGGVDQLLVRVDGMNLREFFHGREFGGITSVVPGGAIGRIDVYPAGFPANMGGRLSGAVDLDLRAGGDEGTHGSVAADATSARLLVEGNTPTGSYLVSARQSYLDRILDRIQDEAVVRPRYRDLLLHAVHRPDPARSISVNYLRTEDHALYSDRVDAHFVDADYGDDYLWSTFRFLPTGNVSVGGTLHRAWTHDRRDFGIGGHAEEGRERVGGRLQVQIQDNAHLWSLGGEAAREWGHWAFEAAGAPGAGGVATPATEADALGQPEMHAYARTLGAAWIQDDWRASDRLTFHLGLRYSRDGDTNRDFYAPRASAALQVPHLGSLRGYWGAYDQPPRKVPDATTDEQFVAEELQVAEHRGIGLEREWAGVRFGMDAYEKIFHRLDGVVTRVTSGVEERHFVTHGRSRGVEAFVRRIGRTSNWWFAYTLGRSEWSDGERTFSRDFDQLHALTFSNTIQLDADWDVGFTYAFHTGTPYTEQTWQRAGENDWALTEGLPNGARLPDYHRLDVRLRRQFRFETWDLSVYAEALNVTNHPNVLWYGWRIYDDRGPLPEAERVTRRGVPGVPSVGLEVRF